MNEIPSRELIKELAKEHRKNHPEMSHCQCLDYVVQDYGFKSHTSYLYALNPNREKGEGNPISERIKRKDEYYNR